MGCRGVVEAENNAPVRMRGRGWDGIDDLGVRPSTSPASDFDRERRRGNAVDESGAWPLPWCRGGWEGWRGDRDRYGMGRGMRKSAKEVKREECEE